MSIRFKALFLLSLLHLAVTGTTNHLLCAVLVNAVTLASAVHPAKTRRATERFKKRRAIWLATGIDPGPESSQKDATKLSPSTSDSFIQEQAQDTKKLSPQTAASLIQELAEHTKKPSPPTTVDALIQEHAEDTTKLSPPTSDSLIQEQAEDETTNSPPEESPTTPEECKPFQTWYSCRKHKQCVYSGGEWKEITRIDKKSQEHILRSLYTKGQCTVCSKILSPEECQKCTTEPRPKECSKNDKCAWLDDTCKEKTREDVAAGTFQKIFKAGARKKKLECKELATASACKGQKARNRERCAWLWSNKKQRKTCKKRWDHWPEADKQVRKVTKPLKHPLIKDLGGKELAKTINTLYTLPKDLVEAAQKSKALARKTTGLVQTSSFEAAIVGTMASEHDVAHRQAEDAKREAEEAPEAPEGDAPSADEEEAEDAKRQAEEAPEAPEGHAPSADEEEAVVERTPAEAERALTAPEEATEALVAQPQKTTPDEEMSSDESASQQMAAARRIPETEPHVQAAEESAEQTRVAEPVPGQIVQAEAQEFPEAEAQNEEVVKEFVEATQAAENEAEEEEPEKLAKKTKSDEKNGAMAKTRAMGPVLAIVGATLTL